MVYKSERQFPGSVWFVDTTGQGRIAPFFDKKATASKLTTIYNQDVQKNGEWTGS